jgi:tRNA threonylcarbamoyladenosine biosynthesis protein TsaE
MKKNQILVKEHEIIDSARKFLDVHKGDRHFAFYGPMGVGKTTFIKALCFVLGAKDLVSSPTFAIVNEYFTQDNLSIYHFDFYRIKTIVELLDIGFDEYCQEEAFCFIEWPEKGEELLPEDFIKVTLAEQADGNRVLNF